MKRQYFTTLLLIFTLFVGCKSEVCECNVTKESCAKHIYNFIDAERWSSWKFYNEKALIKSEGEFIDLLYHLLFQKMQVYF